VLRRITHGVGVPVTADVEAGYGLAGRELVEALLDAGAVGCNIEDTDHATGAGFFDADATAAGVPIVINARVDMIARHPRRDALAVMPETVRRARLRIEAGADCVYPLGLSASSLVAELAGAVGGPLNVNPSVPLAALAEAGAARVSIGPGAFGFVMAEFGRRAEKLLAGDAAAFS